MKSNDRLGFTTDNSANSTVIGHTIRESADPGTYNTVVMSRVSAPPPQVDEEYIFSADGVLLNFVFYIAADVQTGEHICYGGESYECINKLIIN